MPVKKGVNDKKAGPSRETKSAAMSKEPRSRLKGTPTINAPKNKPGESAVTINKFHRKQGGSKAINKAEANEFLFQQIGKTLTQHQWYHGLMPRYEIEEMLKEEGDYLVRKTTVNNQPTYCISVKHDREAKHIEVHYKDAQWTLKSVTRTTLSELIEHYEKTGTPIQPSGAVLRRTVPRPDYYILHENVQLGTSLGSGAFGEVCMGVLTLNSDTKVPCAVKKLKGVMSKKQKAEFMQEGKIMMRFNHSNIVRFYGIAPQEEPIMLLFELAPGGSLISYCNKHESELTTAILMNFSIDAAKGMAYLSHQKVIHRDLAARNCLLGANLEVKIADFGLSLSGDQVKMDKLKSMPIKWLSPETLSEGVFSLKTDVWSFGVLLWEIFAKCKESPFPGETNAEAREKILSKRPPMQPPPGSPPIVAAAMALCFSQDPETRPDFDTIVKMLYGSTMTGFQGSLTPGEEMTPLPPTPTSNTIPSPLHGSSEDAQQPPLGAVSCVEPIRMAPTEPMAPKSAPVPGVAESAAVPSKLEGAKSAPLPTAKIRASTHKSVTKTAKKTGKSTMTKNK